MNYLDSAALGISSGGAYALIALGIVAVFRGTGVVNFAQASIGMFTTYLFWTFFYDLGLPVGLAVVLGIVSGGLIGVAFYVLVGRRLLSTPVATRILVTLGLTLTLEAIVNLTWGNDTRPISNFLVSGNVTIFGVAFPQLGIVLLGVAVVAAAGLSLLFNRTPFGRISTAFQDSPVGAQSLGHSPVRYGVISWTLGGVLAAIAGILFSPKTQLVPTGLEALLIPGLGAALLARFRSFWIAFWIALATGIVETLAVTVNLPSGYNEAVPYCVTILAVVLGGRSLPGRGTVESKRLVRVGNGKIRWLPLLVAGGAAALVIFTMADTWVDAMTVSGVYALLSLGIVISVGYTGQVVLTPLLFVATSLLLTTYTSAKGVPMLPAMLIGPVAAAVVGLIIGIPSVRVRGVGLTIATIGLAATVQILVFSYSPFFNPPFGWTVGSDDLFGLGFSFNNILYPDRLAALAWVLVLIVGIALARFRSARGGRRLLATRADERGAAAAGISVRQAKVAAFALSSLVCALAGSVMAFELRSLGLTALGGGLGAMTWQASLSLVALLVFAGAGYLPGAILAGLFAAGGIIMQALNFAPSVNDWISLFTGLNLSFVLVSQPDGIVGNTIRQLHQLAGTAVVARLRGTVSGWRPEAWRRPRAEAVPAEADVALLQPRLAAQHRDDVLRVAGVGLHYGGVQAVSDVSFTLAAGKVIGVLGPNGAGKSSLVDAITGFMRTDAGTVQLDGRDVTTMPPHERIRLGLARTFQDNLLFEDLTVRENLEIATDRNEVGAYVSGLVGLGRTTARDEDVVAAAAALVGVGHLLDEPVENLSLGWHARVTLARVLAARPTVLCLDEPAAALSAGARAEVSEVIRQAAHQLGIAVLLIEHNIDVVLDTCDELIVMDRGRVIAQGQPDEVLALTAVREAYLGDLGSEQVAGQVAASAPEGNYA